MSAPAPAVLAPRPMTAVGCSSSSSTDNAAPIADHADLLARKAAAVQQQQPAVLGHVSSSNTNAPAPAAGAKATSAAFTQADKNGDGQLSREEAATLPAVAANYDKVDANADGSISAEEFTKAVKR